MSVRALVVAPPRRHEAGIRSQKVPACQFADRISDEAPLPAGFRFVRLLLQRMQCSQTHPAYVHQGPCTNTGSAFPVCER